MGTTAETSDLHSPSGIGLNHRRSTSSSPWAQVVRGKPESAPSPAVTTTPNNAAAKSNAARSKPSNGAIEAESWPPLSESTTRSLADSSSMNADTSEAPTIQHALVPLHDMQLQSVSTTPNHALPVQQRYMRRGGGGGSSHSRGGHSLRGFTHPPPPPPFPIFQLPPNSYGTLIPPLSNSSSRESLYFASTWETRPIMGFVPQPRIVNDHRIDILRGNYHNNFGSGRDHPQTQRGFPRDIVRPPPPALHNTAPFTTPQSVRPFPTAIGFSDASSQLVYHPQLPSFRGVPFITPRLPSFFIPPQEKPLSVRLLDQIEFYFR